MWLCLPCVCLRLAWTWQVDINGPRNTPACTKAILDLMLAPHTVVIHDYRANCFCHISLFFDNDRLICTQKSLLTVESFTLIIDREIKFKKGSMQTLQRGSKKIRILNQWSISLVLTLEWERKKGGKGKSSVCMSFEDSKENRWKEAEQKRTQQKKNPCEHACLTAQKKRICRC